MLSFTLVALLLANNAIFSNAQSSASSSNSVCSNSTVDVTSQSVLTSIQSCETISGTLDFTNSNLAVVDLGSIKTVRGDIRFSNNTQLSSISAPNLVTIGGNFYLNSLTILNTLSCPKLTNVGSIAWVTLPALSGLQFNSVVSNASNVYISDTGLQSLEGISLTHVGTFDVNNNRDLSDLTVNFLSVSEYLDVSFNGQRVVASFPYLQWANNITFQDVTNVSLPSLTTVNASIGFINNTFDTLYVNNLTTVGGSFSVQYNPDLYNISFSSLKTVSGGFTIANNTLLDNISGFPYLKTIGGGVDIVGNFTNATFPSLNSIAGGVYVNSTNEYDCDFFTDLNKSGDIRGNKFVCNALSTSTSITLSASHSSTSSDSTQTGDVQTTGTSTSTSSSSSSTTSHKSDASARYSAASSDFKYLLYTIVAIPLLMQFF